MAEQIGRMLDPSELEETRYATICQQVLERLQVLPRSFNVGVDQLLAVQRLLLELARRNALPESFDALAPYVRPLVCRSPEQQQEFDICFRPPEPKPAPLPPTPRPPPHPDVSWARRRYALWFVVSALCLLALASVVLFRALRPPPSPPPAKPPTVGATGPKPAVVAKPHEQVVQNELELRTDVVRRQPVPLTRQLLTARAPQLLEALALLWLVAWGLRRLRAWLEARRFLARDAGAQPQSLERLVRGIQAELPTNAADRRLANTLRERELAAAEDLDLAASVHASSKAAGELVAVKKPRRRSPDYLALVERDSRHDQQAAFFDGWLQQLKRADVAITRYFFKREPQLLFEHHAAVAPLTLERVQAPTLEHRLLLFSDGDPLIDPLSGHPRAILGELNAWEHRVLVTPEAEPYWGEREQRLAAALPVVPATRVGLARSRAAEHPFAGTPESEQLSAVPLPAFIRRRARTWLHDDAPSKSDQALLLAHLKTYLDPPGYVWLVACALYPQVRWELTLALGKQLLAEDGSPLLQRERLLHLARLPWLRAAYFPDWLRTALLRSLSYTQLESTRTALSVVLATPLAPASKALVLELAQQAGGPLREVWRTLRRRLQKSAPATDAVNDLVFQRWIDDGIGLRMPIAAARRLRSRLLSALPVPSGPPGYVANAFSSLTVFGLVYLGVFYALTRALHAPDTAIFLQSDLLLRAAVAQLVATSAVLLRWARPEYRSYGLLLRVFTDIPLPGVVIAVSAWLLDPSPDHSTARPFIDVELFAIVLMVVGLALTRLLEPGWLPLPRFLTSLAAFADRVMPDRWLYAARREPRTAREGTFFSGAVIAVLSGPLTLGYATPPFIAGAIGRAYFARAPVAWVVALLQSLLAVVPLLLIAVPLPWADDAQNGTPYGVAIGLLSLLVFSVVKLRFGRAATADSGAGIRHRFREWMVAVQAFSPERLLDIRPLAFPLATVGLGLVLAAPWELTEFSTDWVARSGATLSRLHWPQENAITQSWTVGADEPAALSRDGSELFAAGMIEAGPQATQTLGAWKLGKSTGSLTQLDSDITAIAVAQDGAILACSRSGKCTLRDRDSARSLVGHTSTIRGVAFANDDTVAVTCADDGSARVWDLKGPKSAEITSVSVKAASPCRDVWLSPDGTKVIVSGLSGDASVATVDGNAYDHFPKALAIDSQGTKIYDTHDGQVLKLGSVGVDSSAPVSIPVDPQTVNFATFSPDGTQLAIVTKTGRLELCDATRDAPARELSLLAGPRPVFSPDGKYLAAILRDNAVSIWALSGAAGPWTFRKAHWPQKVIWSLDGTTLAVAYAWVQPELETRWHIGSIRSEVSVANLFRIKSQPAPGPTPTPIPTPVPLLPSLTLDVVNEAPKLVTQAELERVIAAVNQQLDRDFLPYWSRPAKLRFAKQRPKNSQGLVILENEPSVEEALAYHQFEKGMPVARISIKMAKKSPEPWSIAMSHEVLAMVADPHADVTYTGPHPKDPKLTATYVGDICDPVQSDTYTIDGVQVSDFVLPSYFVATTPPGTQNDFMNVGVAPFKVHADGYLEYSEDEGKTFKMLMGEASGN